MEFYTNISRYGNQLLYRGYKDGRRIQTKIPFSPTLYVPVEKSTAWKALDGKSVEPVRLETMREAKEFLERYRDVSNFEIYGNTNYIAQFVAEKFPNEIKFDPSLINITFASKKSVIYFSAAAVLYVLCILFKSTISVRVKHLTHGIITLSCEESKLSE